LKVADGFNQREKQQALRGNVLNWINGTRTYVADAYPSAHKIDQSYIKEKPPIMKNNWLLQVSGLHPYCSKLQFTYSQL